MILVTGASGHLGRRIVDRLIVRAGGAYGVAASVRDPARAAHLAERGVSVRQGDFDQPDGLRDVFAGVDKLIPVSTDGPKGLRIAQHRRAISVAQAPALARNVYELSGAATHDYHEVAAAVARVSGRQIRYQPVSEDAYAVALAATGVPGRLACSLANLRRLPPASSSG